MRKNQLNTKSIQQQKKKHSQNIVHLFLSNFMI